MCPRRQRVSAGLAVLFPVDEDPLDGIRAAVGDAFAAMEADELKPQAREAVSREVHAEADGQSQDGKE
jgi:hypothetical protein